MLAKLLRPNAAEYGLLADRVGIALIQFVAGQGARAAPEAVPDLSAIRRSIGHAYDSWWFSLPWWQVLWLSGAVERRHRLFVDHAVRRGLMDKWAKRLTLGIGVVRSEPEVPAGNRG